MDFKKMIADSINDNDPSKLKDGIDELCKSNNLKLVKCCKCEEASDYKSILAPQDIEKVERLKIRHIRKTRRLVNKILNHLRNYGSYSGGHVTCLHYAKGYSWLKPKENGIVFVTEYVKGIQPDSLRIKISNESNSTTLDFSADRGVKLETIEPIQVFAYGDGWNEGKMNVSESVSHLFISDPNKSPLDNLFATHPPLEERIKILRAM